VLFADHARDDAAAQGRRGVAARGQRLGTTGAVPNADRALARVIDRESYVSGADNAVVVHQDIGRSLVDLDRLDLARANLLAGTAGGDRAVAES
jgi:hypothetical protein